ncbi:hypothetical protein [Solibacillus ferritrahens]|uniref:hypothetical protein n=1 Tax=Solibacillus ferritrahens TaxID=3098620 RepID=UPI00300B97E1
MCDIKDIKNTIEKIFISETVDGLHFWGPKLMLSVNNNLYDEVYICIEGAFKIKENEEIIRMEMGDTERLPQLCRLAFQKIITVELVAANDLYVTFESGIELEVFGYNDAYEGWQMEARLDGEQLLIVAGPGDSITVFE